MAIRYDIIIRHGYFCDVIWRRGGLRRMSDIKLFNISGGVQELPASSVTLERELQLLIERDMRSEEHTV